MANYAYDSPTMNAAIDVYSSACSIVKAATDSVSSAQHVLSSIASAGGDLGAEIGGTVLGNVKNATSSLQQAMMRAQSVGSALGAAKQILEGIDSDNYAYSGLIIPDEEGHLHAVVRKTPLPTAGDMINTIGSNTWDSTPDHGEYQGFIDTVGVIGDLVSKATAGDPITSAISGNARGIAEAIVEGRQIQDGVADSYITRLRNGEIGAGEYFSGGLAAGTANAVVTIADGVANAIGIDIPPSVNRTITDIAGKGGEAIYEVTSSVVKSWMNWRSPGAGVLGSLII